MKVKGKYSDKAYSRLLEANKIRRQEKKDFIDSYKLEKGCECPDCQWEGEFIPEMLDLDHLDHSKKNPKLKRNGCGLWSLGWDSLLDEISKCQVLCANCHRVKTTEER